MENTARQALSRDDCRRSRRFIVGTMNQAVVHVPNTLTVRDLGKRKLMRGRKSAPDARVRTWRSRESWPCSKNGCGSGL